MSLPRILFVDDEPAVLHAYRRLLGERYDVTLETDPFRALRRISEEPPFTVIIADLRMPGLNGVDLLARASALAPESTRILLTGYGDYDSAVAALNRGQAFRFLSKPCSEAVLEAAVADAVQRCEQTATNRERFARQRLRTLMDGVLCGLSTLVERRDPYTAGHQRRVADLASAIAEALGLDELQREVLVMAARIHDIGKIYVPSDFLNKPGRLSEAEFSIIRMHPEVGADILASVDTQWPISEIILQHHERLDGSGYPRGLRGEDIRIEARILAVADVADAMISQRPYRAALGLESAVRELREGRGVLYQLEAVDACLELLRSGRFPLDDFSPSPHSEAV